ncbi:MAG: hypothetical protein JJU29_12035 [Verrucomicrobia bacterium]|nr:hypothetical protein [Verrucomicrobiota bacterium]MCH8511683.1 hypothetical protein [Kiritimatiellia bacterium]
MNIFLHFFKRKKIHTLKDPVFGPLTFENKVWVFLPNSEFREFMITVDAPQEGPSHEQRDFFQRISLHLPEYETKAREYIKSRAEPHPEVDALSIYSVEIENVALTSREEFVLELADAEATEIHRVSFRRGECIDYGVDD